MEKRQPLQQMLLGKALITLQKTETRSIQVSIQSGLGTLISKKLKEKKEFNNE
jgi:hypothetical protein